MLQRATILEAWRRAGQQRGVAEAGEGATRAPGPAAARQSKAQAFFDLVRERPEPCWKELAEEFRRNYYDAIDEIVPPILALDDPLISLNCVRLADVNRPQEVALLRQFVRDADPEKHQFSLRELAGKPVPEIQAALRKRSDLPESVREALEQSTTRANRPPSPRRRSGSHRTSGDSPA